MHNTIISPIPYMGCKKKIIPDLLEIFPSEIDTFYDIFSGSGIVSMNVKALKYVMNDINSHLIELYNAFRDYPYEHIVRHIEQKIDEYGLPKMATKKEKEIRETYKDSYIKYRDFYNETKNPLDLITLCKFSFCQQFRFGTNGNYNMPMGNDYFSELNKSYIKNGTDFFHNNNITILNKSVFDCDFTVVTNKDFIYFDPPYYNTVASYNENDGWTFENEMKFLNLLDDLNKKGIKWCMSNVFVCRGKENTHLSEWCDNNKYNIKHLDLKYSVCGKGSSANDEVVIYNYDKEMIKQKSLF